MGKLYNPADYNLAANPSLPKTNSPWPFWSLLFLFAVVLALGWTFFTPGVRLTRPAISFSPGQITATTEATNRTATPVTVNVRFTVGTKGRDTALGSGQFTPLAHQDVSATIAPRSTSRVSCSFALPSGQVPNEAEAQLFSRQ